MPPLCMYNNNDDNDDDFTRRKKGSSRERGRRRRPQGATRSAADAHTENPPNQNERKQAKTKPQKPPVPHSFAFFWVLN